MSGGRRRGERVGFAVVAGVAEGGEVLQRGRAALGPGDLVVHVKLDARIGGGASPACPTFEVVALEDGEAEADTRSAVTGCSRLGQISGCRKGAIRVVGPRDEGFQRALPAAKPRNVHALGER